MDTLKDRIKKIMAEKNMNQATFADYINVGRPNITHIMTGRDKSSQKVISRILLAFPEISSKWLLNGEGEMYRTIPSKTQMQVDEALHQYEQQEMQTSLFAQEEIDGRSTSFADELPIQSPAPKPSPETIQVSSSSVGTAAVSDISEPSPASAVTNPAVSTPAPVMEVASAPSPEPSPASAVTNPAVSTPAPVMEVASAPSPEPSVATQAVCQPAAVSETKDSLMDSPMVGSSSSNENIRPQGKRIRKIVFFYEDRSFEEFFPSG